MAAWQVGEGLVIMLAALRDIPPDLYDAALVDGAGAWARFRRIVLPLIAPTFLLLALPRYHRQLAGQLRARRCW